MHAQFVADKNRYPSLKHSLCVITPTSTSAEGRAFARNADDNTPVDQLVLAQSLLINESLYPNWER